VSLSLLWSSLSLIWLRDAWKSHDGRRAQLCGANFVLKEGERLHLAGDNGCGKSSLLKILAGVDRLDKGELIIKKGLRIWLVAQEALEDVEGSITVRETLLNGEGTAFVAAREYETALGLLKEDGESPNILRRYERALEAAEREDAWALEARLNTAVQKLGISHLMHRPVSALSGGEKKRTALAAAIAADADVLLLDEPTNHLDIWATRWLEQYLLREATNTAVIFISHDRRFAVQVAQGVLELDNGYLYRHEKQDNINDDLVEIYLRNKAKRLLDDETASQTARVKLKRELAWLRQGAKARQTKAKHRIQNVQILKNEAQSNQRFQVKDLSPTNSKENKNTQKKQTKTALLEIDDLYAHDCFEQFCFELGRGDRHAIIGSNGSGKSSLAAAIAAAALKTGQLVAGGIFLTKKRVKTDGHIRFAKNVRVAYYAQDISQLREMFDMTPLDVAIDIISQRDHFKPEDITTEAIKLLERYAFEEHIIRTARLSDLSGGELRRLQLASILDKPCDLLIADEPSNDLDLATLQSLERFLLNDFNGALLLVSHDRALVDATCNSLLVLPGDGFVSQFSGSIDDYIQLMDSADDEYLDNHQICGSTQDSTEDMHKARRRRHNAPRDIAKLEQQIEERELELAKLDDDLQRRGADLDALQDLYDQRTQLQSHIDVLYAQWEELEQLLATVPE